MTRLLSRFHLWRKGLDLRPHEIALLLACTIFGIAGLVARDRVTTPAMRAYSAPYLQMWIVGLLVGGVLGLAGAAMTSGTGMLLECAGMVLVGSLLVGYSITAASNPAAVFAPIFMSFFGIASFWRAGELALDLRRAIRVARVSLAAARRRDGLDE